MKKRLLKVLALGLTAAMVAGTPLSAMAAETDVTGTAQDEMVTGEIDAVQTQESDAGIAMQSLVPNSPVINGADPMSMDGVIQLNDGNWYYFDHGKLKYTKGLYPNSAGWWYVRSGKVDFTYNGLYKYGGSDWYVQNGQIQFGYTGAAAIDTVNDYQQDETVYYIANGKADYNFTGVRQTTIDGETAWYYFENGTWERYTETLAEYGGSWWYVNDGKIDFNYQGTVWYNGAEWYVNHGSVDFGFSGRVEGYQEINDSLKVPFQTYFINGMQQMDLTGVYYTDVDGVYDWYGFYEGQLATRDWYYGPTIGYVLSNAGGWWYIDPGTGKVDFSYTGMAENDYGIWYMNNGQIDFGYNGSYKQRPYKLEYAEDYYDLYVVSGGKADCNYDGILWTTIDGVSGWYGFGNGHLSGDVALLKKDDGTWWYVGDNGMVDFSYTGDAYAYNGQISDEYYIENGQINFGLSGTIKVEDVDADVYQYYQNGKKADWDFNGLVETSVNGEYGWYYVEHGMIYHEGNAEAYYVADLVSNENGWWAVFDGKIDFSYTGFVWDNVNKTNGKWYVRNGQIDFGANGLIDNGENAYYYVTNGYVNLDLDTVALATINGENAWWFVHNGELDPTISNSGIAEYNGTVWYYDEGKINFDESGTYDTIATYPYYESGRLIVEYRYEVVNGKVMSMTAEVLDRYPWEK